MADVLTVELDGKRYELDLDSITPREFRAIKTYTGLRAGQFIRSFAVQQEMDADAVMAFVWLCRSRAGESGGFDDDLPVFEILGTMRRPAAQVAAREGDDGDEEDGDGDSPKGSGTSLSKRKEKRA